MPADSPLLACPIHDTPFVVIDTETTGVSPDKGDRVIEFGAVKVLGGKIVDRYQQLVNPGRAVPQRITALTGISTAMLLDQPSAEQALPDLLAFLGDGVFAAHNLPFDQRFLHAELTRAGLPLLPNPTLCTLRLARRLLRGLKSKGLASVSDFYGIRIVGRHRALGDAEATGEVLIRFLRRLAFEQEMETTGEVLAFQFRPYSKQKGKGSRHIRRIAKDILPGLPPRPGVYFMKNAAGTTLYIGKAKNLKNRVGSYFSGIEGHSGHIRKLVGEIRDVEWIETGSELSALLLESKRIKAEKPPFNRASRRYRNRPFIRLGMDDPFPSVRLVRYLERDGADYFGPLGGRGQGEMLMEVMSRAFKLRECEADTFRLGRACLYADLERCTAPCENGDTPEGAARYAEEVAAVRAFLEGRDRTVLDTLDVQMRAAAKELDFETARKLRDWLKKLEALVGKQQQVATSVWEHNAVLIEPGVEAGTVQLFLIRCGRLAQTLTVAETPSRGDAARLRTALADHFGEDADVLERYLKEEVDEVRILAHWMYVRRETARQIPWDGDTAEAFAARIVTALRT